MTVTSEPVRQPDAEPLRRNGVGWGDLLWLTWRQHRWSVGGLAVLVGLAVLAALLMAWVIRDTGHTDHELWVVGFSGGSRLLSIMPMLMGLVVAVFWAAPLLSREYEHKTHLVVWSQDLPATRWLVGKVVLLGAAGVGLSAALGAAVLHLLRAVNSVSQSYLRFPPFHPESYEAMPLMQVGYTAFGFALGLALSALTRRTVLSMGLALGAYVVVRAVVAFGWRPYFQAPLRVVEPLDTRTPSRLPADALFVDGGYVTAAGEGVSFPDACRAGFDSEEGYRDCLADNGIVGYFTDYQPVERLLPFQLFEFAVYVVLTAVLLALAHLWVRRAHRA